jgi:hypothetical protein
MNFKGGQTFWEKYEKFSKFLSWLGLHKIEFSWAHIYARILSYNTSVRWLGLNKRKEFEFENQTSQLL